MFGKRKIRSEGEGDARTPMRREPTFGRDPTRPKEKTAWILRATPLGYRTSGGVGWLPARDSPKTSGIILPKTYKTIRYMLYPIIRF
jgi:hypothetical protein